MEEIESQVAKIHIGNPKATTSYVSVYAEKAPSGTAELYVITELPLFNPAALESCEKISLSIAATLRRAYRKGQPSSFENAVAQVNDELGKLAALGQTHWIDKLSAIIAVKEGGNFNITTSGKVSAFLFRGKEFTDISCSSEQSHPLKTFENVAAGKIRLGDLLILSTTQLFNYLSMDRLKDILTHNGLLLASQTVIEILRENAGPDVAFGTLLNLQVEAGETTNEEIDLEEYVTNQEPGIASKIASSAKLFMSNAIAKTAARKPRVELPKISMPENFRAAARKGFTMPSYSSVVSTLRWDRLKTGLVAAKNFTLGTIFKTWNKLNLRNFNSFSPYKKFFIISATFLLLVVLVNIGLAVRLSRTRASEKFYSEKMNEVKLLLDKTQNSLLYRNDTQAKDFLTQAQAAMPVFADIPEASHDTYHTLENSITDLKIKMDKVTEVEAQTLGNLGLSPHLIKLPSHLAIQVNGNIVSYSKDTQLFQDGVFISKETIDTSVYTTGNLAAIYNNGQFFVWDFQKGTVGAAFSVNVPKVDEIAGLAFYPTNSRIYTVNKQTKQILTFLVSENSIGRPVVWSQSLNDLSNAVDVAIDGSVYVLNTNGINKYHAGQPAEFEFPKTFTPFSGQGKLYTNKDFRNLYLLDTAANRIYILAKNGQLVSTITSKQFTHLTDFQVDEKNKMMYLLNNSSLLKISF